MRCHKALVFIFVFVASCSENSISMRTSALMQARQLQIDIAGFRDRNSGRFPENIDELISFLSVTDGFVPTDSQFVFNDRYRGRDELWLYQRPSNPNGKKSILFQSPKEIDGRFIVGLSNGKVDERHLPPMEPANR